MTKRKGINILLVLLAAVAVLALSFVGARMGMASRAEAESAAEIPDAYSGIILAGYDRIKLRAEQKEQSVYFYNPQENECFLVFSLLLDGEELCSSGFLAPNTKVETVRLSKTLPAGEYADAVLRYSCYDLYTQRELNGAEIAVKLEVK